MKTLYEYQINDFLTSKASEQNAIDLFKDDWISSLPAEVTAGYMGLFNRNDDIRPRFVTDRFGSIKGWNVLDLGSFEGGHAYQLENEGANVIGVEANPYIFLRSLIAKNALNMRGKFLLGDFTQYLDGEAKYDMIFCSGVLYHMPDPVDLIKRMSTQTDRVFLWTHYVGDENAKTWEPNFNYENDGFQCIYYRYVYDPVMRGRSYAGSEQFASRVTQDTILKALNHYGFKDIVIAKDEPDHPGGPAFSLTAARV